MAEYEYKKEYSLLPEGDYEAIIEAMEVRTLPTSGKEKLAITFRLENGRKIFEDIWKPKDNPTRFNPKRINQLLVTQDIENGTKFNGIENVIDFLVGKPVIVHVVKVYDDYYEEDKNSVKFYKSSKNKPQKLEVKTGIPEATTDDDLPF